MLCWETPGGGKPATVAEHGLICVISSAMRIFAGQDSNDTWCDYPWAAN